MRHGYFQNRPVRGESELQREYQYPDRIERACHQRRRPMQGQENTGACPMQRGCFMMSGKAFARCLSAPFLSPVSAHTLLMSMNYHRIELGHPDEENLCGEKIIHVSTDPIDRDIFPIFNCSSVMSMSFILMTSGAGNISGMPSGNLRNGI